LIRGRPIGRFEKRISVPGSISTTVGADAMNDSPVSFQTDLRRRFMDQV